jgi:Integrase core domain
MSSDTTRFFKGCPSCCQSTLKNQKRARKLRLLPPTAPLEQVAIDVLGPLTKTRSGNRCLLVMTDRFRKVTRAATMKGVTAEETAQAFLDVWVSSYGVPMFLLSDNGGDFISRFFQRVTQVMSIHHLFTAAYHPACNGQAERFNAYILDKLRTFIDEDQRDWDQYTATLTYAYNSQPNATTGFSPFELVVPEAANMRTLKQELFETMTGMPTTKSHYRETLMKRVHEVAQLARGILKERQLRYKVAHDAHVRERNMQIRDGGFSYVKRMVVEQGMSPKLAIPVERLFEILKTSHIFKLRTSNGDVIVSSDRVTKAPAPTDLSTPLTPYTRPNQGNETGGDVEEFIVERIISHEDLNDGARVARVRWHGYDDSAYIWETVSEIPMSFMRRYARRRKLALSDVLPTELMPDKRVVSRRMTKPSQEPLIPTNHALFLYS